MIKRVFDIFFSLIGLIFFFPVLFVISIILRFFSDEPVFFMQKRVGKNGELFKLIKFRTMITDCNHQSTISLKGDPRVTKIGKVLRRFKLDEMPSLYNVLIGEMSFVGPRPDVSGYADMLVGEQRKILEIKPGITGPASLKYAKEEYLLSKQKNPKLFNDKVIYHDKIRINLEYYYNNNFWIDIKIIFATVIRIIS